MVRASLLQLVHILRVVDLGLEELVNIFNRINAEFFAGNLREVKI